ncbi:MAG TPA: hypothetical protein VJT75_12225 [Thermoleophilaceae bacterium]|nr:hypothetical protein [Thermoleophilaceae bacterium]
MPSDAKPLSAWLSNGWTGGALSSPKLVSSASKTAGSYRYYAGYADAFVADVVARLPQPTGLVLDPWNGSGTTTSVAAAHGLEARGFDINPAAVVISKARLLQSDVAPSLLPLTRKLLTAVDADAALSQGDLLLRWMTPRAAAAVRRLAATINRSLIELDDEPEASRLASEMSSLAALFYLALFRVVRRALGRFAGTNPTWLRQKVAQDEKVDIDLRTLRPWLLAAMGELAEAVKERGLPELGGGRIEIAVADSSQLPIQDGAAQAVITSPPYCTRIDYAVATLPELAALGMTASDFRALRDRLIGTPTRDGTFASSDLRWGKTATSFLREVADHRSHASTGYYLSFFSQYFAGMWRSLSEVGRVVASDRPIVLVVQDSYYKEVRADIPCVMCEMADRLGWRLSARRDFQVRTKANINAGTRKYRQPSLATESVLAFSK